jgi:hypothetical protein
MELIVPNSDEPGLNWDFGPVSSHWVPVRTSQYSSTSGCNVKPGSLEDLSTNQLLPEIYTQSRSGLGKLDQESLEQRGT